MEIQAIAVLGGEGGNTEDSRGVRKQADAIA
jgi:hypothetical protein